MSKLMAKAHADWHIKGQLIALTLGLNGNRDLCRELEEVLAKLDLEWIEEYGDAYTSQLKLSENLSGQKNVVKFPDGDGS